MMHDCNINTDNRPSKEAEWTVAYAPPDSQEKRNIAAKQEQKEKRRARERRELAWVILLFLSLEGGKGLISLHLRPPIKTCFILLSTWSKKRNLEMKK